jgi:hypothetical protein
MIRVNRRAVRVLSVAYPIAAVAGVVLAVVGLLHRAPVSAFVGGLLAGSSVGLTIATLWWHMANHWWETANLASANQEQWRQLYYTALADSEQQLRALAGSNLAGGEQVPR